jgi:protocatechuate 3,4-dioxygenase beta subunit
MRTIPYKSTRLGIVVFLLASSLPATTRLADAAISAPDASSNRTVLLHGKVVGPESRPVAGAKFYLNVDEWTDSIELGASGADGTYRFEVPESKLRRTVASSTTYGKCKAALIVAAEGLGPGWELLPDVKGGRYGEMKPEYAHDFRLPADFPIAGQVLDAVGKPVVGASVAVDRIFELGDGTWWKMHPAIKANDTNLMTQEQTDPNNWFTPLYPTAWSVIQPATTDAEGRFRLTGLGFDRAVKLEVTGPGIRRTSFSVLTRDDADKFTKAVRDRYPRTRREPNGYFYPERPGASQGDPGVMLFGPAPTIEVDPARTVAGVVRDAGTGEPIAGVRVQTADMFGAGRGTTDKEGRYRLVRAEDGKSINIFTYSFSETDKERYLRVVRRLTDADGLGEITADLDVPRGVVIEGRVVEAGTDQPIVSAPRRGCHDTVPGPLVAGHVVYYPLITNTALRGTPTGLYFEGFRKGSQNYSTSAVIDGEGRFRMAVPPGPGVLLVRAYPGGSYEFGAWKESDGVHRLFPYAPLTSRTTDDGAPQDAADSFSGFTGPIRLTNYHAYRVIDPAADVTTLDVTLEVPRATSRMLQFVDPEGRAIQGVAVWGLVGTAPWMAVEFDGSEAEAIGLAPGENRQLRVKSNDGKHIGKTSVNEEDPQLRTVRLEAAARITGRLVDENGNPVKALLSPQQSTNRADGGGDIGVIPQVRSDEQGRFEIALLMPGERYSAEIRGGQWDQEVIGAAFENIVLGAGEVRDVGDIRVKSVAKTEANSVK